MSPLVSYRPGFAELSQFEVHPPSVRLLPRAFCRRAALVVLGRVEPGDTQPAVIGAVELHQDAAFQEVARQLGRAVEVVQLNLYEVDRALLLGHEVGTVRVGEELRRIAVRGPAPAGAAAAPELLDAMLAEAVRLGASDIHLECYPDDIDVRLRIDGILHQSFTHVSPDNAAEVVSRVKVLCELDLAERRRPQDGRLRAVMVDGARTSPVDFRVSVLPGPAGEDVVIRVLDASKGLLTIGELGMVTAMQDVFTRLLANPEGLLLVTGPTSSGKTTTLYSALSFMSDQHRKIITAEDPIEYQLDRINQKQVTPLMSMSDLLRAMLRQNPDVVLIGEIRDLESGSTALNAAATGHLVLGTLHTSDALGVVTRLRGLELDDADIAAALLASLGQRLVRRVCPNCREPAVPTEAQRHLFGGLLHERSFWRGRGCPTCRGTGYKGRVGLYELLLVDEVLQDMIADGAALHDLRAHLSKAGFRTMTHDAFQKAGEGVTTLEEITRVVPYRQIVGVRREVESG